MGAAMRLVGGAGMAGGIKCEEGVLIFWCSGTGVVGRCGNWQGGIIACNFCAK